MKKIKSFECLDTYMQERKKTYQESAQRRTRGFLSAKQKDKGISVCETEGQGLFCLRNRRTREFVSAKHKGKGFSVCETEGQGILCLRNIRTRDFLSAKQKDKGISVCETKDKGRDLREQRNLCLVTISAIFFLSGDSALKNQMKHEL